MSGLPRLKASPGQAIVGLVFALLGFLVILAMRGGSTDAFLQSARTEDLVRILDDLSARQARSEAELRRLEIARDRLQSGSEADAVAEAQRRADALAILAGTVPVAGPGITVIIEDPAGDLDPMVVLDAIQELRDAGAEAIQVGSGTTGPSIRVVASTWVGDSRGRLVVDGVEFGPPYSLVALGEGETMATALEIPGGVSDTVRAGGGTIETLTSARLEISAVVDK